MLRLLWLWSSVTAFLLHKYPIEDVAAESQCQIANEKVFSDAIKSQGNTIVFFYADHCSFSFAMANEWGKICQKFPGDGATIGELQEPITVLMVNPLKYETIAKEQGIYQFPDVRLYRTGIGGENTVVNYAGERTATGIVRWLNHLVDSVETITTVEEYTLLANNHTDSVVVLVFVPMNVPGGETTLDALRQHLRDVSNLEQESFFALTHQPEVASHAVQMWRGGKPERAKHASELIQTQMPFLLVMNPFSHQTEATHVLFNDAKEDLEPTLVLFPDEMSFIRPKPGDQPRIESVSVEDRLKSLQNKESMVQIVKEFRVPKVALFHDLSAASILRQASNGLPLLFVIAHENLLKKYAQDIYNIGGYYRADIQVVLLDLELAGYSGPKIMHILGIETDEVPLVSLVKIKRDRLRFMPETIYRPPFSFFQLPPTNDSGPQEAFNQLTTWLQQYANGQVVEFLKSEPLPDPEDIIHGEPLPIVGSNFLKEVMEDTSKDVLVDFYAPWCGHCTQFEPILKKVAKYSTLLKTLKITKIDATRNASPGLRVGSFPTVMLFPAKAKDKPHTYAGQRSPEKLLSWINNHASHKFDVQSVVSKYERNRAGTKLMSEQERIRAVLDEL